ncbi:hypothetical protein [Streptomyces sp. NPDC005799]|uniref:hypothetical protein n=1 Tax=Streptomyces sp. NPDC005799 TaxID=3154678 RepID=UPI0034072A50
MRTLIAKALITATLASSATLATVSTATAAEPCTQPTGGSRCVVDGAGVDPSKQLATELAKSQAAQKCNSGQIRTKHIKTIEIHSDDGYWNIFVTARCW